VSKCYNETPDFNQSTYANKKRGTIETGRKVLRPLVSKATPKGSEAGGSVYGITLESVIFMASSFVPL
jgi:hypothetical protein